MRADLLVETAALTNARQSAAPSRQPIPLTHKLSARKAGSVQALGKFSSTPSVGHNHRWRTPNLCKAICSSFGTFTIRHDLRRKEFTGCKEFLVSVVANTVEPFPFGQ